jgi:cysteine-rich repeat protein
MLVLKGGAQRQRFTATRSECGDGRLDPANGETCDGAEGCAPGSHCDADCVCIHEDQVPPPTVPTSTTTTIPRNVCGDGVPTGSERCDCPAGPCTIDSARSETCETLGFPHGGELWCRSGCNAYDTDRCIRCGDGDREGAEQCDGNDFGPAGRACTGPGETGGELGCTASCTIDRTGCWVCGNGHHDFNEWCDDGNTTSGDGCSATCQRECGDGVVQRTEGCDDGNTTGGDGCAPTCNSEISQSAAGVAIECRDGIAPCDRDTVPGQCSFLAFFCMNNASTTIPPSCFASNIARVDLLGTNTADAATVLNAFRDALLRVGGATTVTSEPTAMVPTPPVTFAPTCGSMVIVVPVSEVRVIDVQVSDDRHPARTDADRLTVACEP